MEIFHKILSALALFFGVSKIGIHLYLNYSYERNVSIGAGHFVPLEFILPYRMEVKMKHQIWKNACNVCYFLAIGCLLLLFLTSIKNLKKNGN